MKNKKGMTLIEVMVAMLVLSIAMIGGISFFTSAYRINYSYMESANRIDHALRYVEKLKVQRRNYPTYEAFPNMGGKGFTAFFVDSEFNDVIDAPPYFYEEYFSGEKKVYGKFDPGTASKYWLFVGEAKKVANAVYNGTSYKGIKIAEHYEKDDYHKRRLAKAFGGAPIKLTDPIKVGPCYLKYTYNPHTGKESGEIYATVTFEKLKRYSYAHRYYENYDPDRQMMKYNVSTNLSGMLLTETNNGRSSYLNTFPEGVAKGKITSPKGRDDYISNTHTAGSDPDCIGTNSDKIFPYSTYNTPASITYVGKYKSLYLSPIILKEDTPQEGSGGGESSSIAESYLFDSRRYYSKRPSIGDQEEVSGIKRGNENSCYQGEISGNDEASVKIPDPEIHSNSNLYHGDAIYVALVYRNTITGREEIRNLYKWTISSVGGGASYPIDPTYAKYRSTFGFAPEKRVNDHRLTRYRRSVYISIWPFESRTAGLNLINKAIADFKDLDERIDYIKKYAAEKGMKTIVIPFIQLYAEDDKSTLCEAL